jgi:hypothetical protein
VNLNFAEYVSLLKEQNAKKRNPSQLYLEYFPLYAMFRHRQTSQSDPQNDFLRQLPSYPFAEWLSMKYHLLWLGGGEAEKGDGFPGSTEGLSAPVSRMHYDRLENLMTMVKGKKRFYLYGPDQSSALYGGTPMIQASLQAKIVKNKIIYSRNRSTVQMQPNVYHTYSPVNVRDPNYTKYPLLKDAKGMICDLEEGETLYLPSHWWHEVTSPLMSCPSLVKGGFLSGQGRKEHWSQQFL